MWRRDGLCISEIGDSSCDTQHALMCASGQVETVGGALQQIPALIISVADVLELGALQTRITDSLAIDLRCPRRLNTRPHGVALLAVTPPLPQ